MIGIIGWGFLLAALGLITVAVLPVQEEKVVEKHDGFDSTDIFIYAVMILSIVTIICAIYFNNN